MSEENLQRNSLLGKIFDFIVKDTGFDPHQEK